jgi:hypothetical protein
MHRLLLETGRLLEDIQGAKATDLDRVWGWGPPHWRKIDKKMVERKERGSKRKLRRSPSHRS